MQESIASTSGFTKKEMFREQARGFGHELVEAICGEVAGEEIGDPCQRLLGVSGGITLEPYLSKQRNLCVLPDMTSNSVVAATQSGPGTS